MPLRLDERALNTLGALHPTAGPEYVSHYNVYGSALINGAPAPGYSSAQAITAMSLASRSRA